MIFLLSMMLGSRVLHLIKVYVIITRKGWHIHLEDPEEPF